MTTEAPSRQAFANMLARHEQERATFAAQLLAEEKAQASQLRAAFNPEAGTALAEALNDIERQLRADHRTGNLHAVQVTDLPSWASTDFPALDAADRAEGRRRVIVHVPRQYADGHRDPIALAVIDVSDAIFGAGSRVRVDQALAARVREMEAERERDARDRERDASRR
jgi:hypothetical protein